MFGVKIISSKTHKVTNAALKDATNVVKSLTNSLSEKESKIEELTLKLYLQTLELKSVIEERQKLIYNQRDNHGRLLRNLNKGE